MIHFVATLMRFFVLFPRTWPGCVTVDNFSANYYIQETFVQFYIIPHIYDYLEFKSWVHDMFIYLILGVGQMLQFSRQIEFENPTGDYTISLPINQYNKPKMFVRVFVCSCVRGWIQAPRTN